ncbi:hypothetical protein MMC20_003375 [Loxospora ochrophaea]|nr:hypothetical protein [Loxospora ochrophaea]
MPAYSAIGDGEGSDAGPSSAASSTKGRRQNRGRGKEVGVIGQASWASSVINLVNTIVGAGVLAMPSAMANMGIVLGTVVIIWAGLTAGFGLYLQTRCARYLERGSSSFFALSQITYPNAAVIFDAAIAIKCFGVGVSYLIIIGDLMPGVVQGFSENAGGYGFLLDRHFWMFSILNEIGNNSPFRTTSVVVSSIGSAGAIYVLVAITGYLSFGNAVDGNIMGAYEPSLSSTIGKAAIVILVMFSYPLQIHPCRASVDAVLKWRPNRKPESPNSSPSRNLLPSSKTSRPTRGEPLGETRFAAITTAIIVLSYIVAMTVSSLEKVLAYVGSTGSTSISFILPGLFYYKISSPDSPHHQRLMKENDDERDSSDDDDEGNEDEGLVRPRRSRFSGWRKDILRKLSLALAIYGLVVMVTCLITNTFFIVAH